MSINYTQELGIQFCDISGVTLGGVIHFWVVIENNSKKRFIVSVQTPEGSAFFQSFSPLVLRKSDT